MTINNKPQPQQGPNTMIRQEDQIRARLLNRLGIYDTPPTAPTSAAQNRRLRILRGMGVGYTIQPSPPDGSAVRDPLGGVAVVREPLKTNETSSALRNNHKKKKSTRIAFDDEVSVIPIPMRNEYSERIKTRIWSNRFELQENAQRNAIEFAAEGWNWRTVCEDDSMFICSVSGELVHPVHCQHLSTEAEPTPSMERGDPVH